jgi:hypothetical protein
VHNDPDSHETVYTRAQIEHAVRLIFESKERFRDVGFELHAAAGPTPDSRGITVIGVPTIDTGAECLSPELVATVREMLAVLLRDTVIDPADIKLESATSREEWFGNPSPETGIGPQRT